jgi:hypothetical protein
MMMMMMMMMMIIIIVCRHISVANDDTVILTEKNFNAN